MSYTLPTVKETPALEPQTVWLVANGDLRETANVAGWPVQAAMEEAIAHAVVAAGWRVRRAHHVDPEKGHGFISSQRMGLECFAQIPPTAPLIVAISVWQYSHHLLAGLRSHEGPVLTVANFVGEAPGLVGLLGLNACLTKMGRDYSSLWSVDFTDRWFLKGLERWLEGQTVEHDDSHVRKLPATVVTSPESELGQSLGRQLRREKAILGVLDEGCMGMYNAIVDDELMNPLGIYKERMSQSALWAEMLRTPETEAQQALEWLTSRGMRFKFGDDTQTELTEQQVLMQLRMYIAVLRLADDFGLDAIGIQYQQGLKDLSPASDLAEGLLNNVDRPPVTSRDGSRVLWQGECLPTANEADEGTAIDAIVTNRVWTAMGLDPATTLHDIRWGEEWDGQFVWVFEISGSVPPSHLHGGYAGAEGWRQSPMYFPLGGSTIRGVSREGEVVWSRVYIANGRLAVDLGRGSAISLPEAETERRWALTTPEWPIMHAVLHGVSRDQMMARHKANHVQVAYAPDAATADAALVAKATMFQELGLEVYLAGSALIA